MCSRGAKIIARESRPPLIGNFRRFSPGFDVTRQKVQMAEIQSMEYGMKVGLPYPPLGTIRASVGQGWTAEGKTRLHTRFVQPHIQCHLKRFY